MGTGTDAEAGDFLVFLDSCDASRTPGDIDTTPPATNHGSFGTGDFLPCSPWVEYIDPAASKQEQLRALLCRSPMASPVPERPSHPSPESAARGYRVCNPGKQLQQVSSSRRGQKDKPFAKKPILTKKTGREKTVAVPGDSSKKKPKKKKTDDGRSKTASSSAAPASAVAGQTTPASPPVVVVEKHRSGEAKTETKTGAVVVAESKNQKKKRRRTADEADERPPAKRFQFDRQRVRNYCDQAVLDEFRGSDERHAEITESDLVTKASERDGKKRRKQKVEHLPTTFGSLALVVKAKTGKNNFFRLASCLPPKLRQEKQKQGWAAAQEGGFLSAMHEAAASIEALLVAMLDTFERECERRGWKPDAATWTEFARDLASDHAFTRTQIQTLSMLFGSLQRVQAEPAGFSDLEERAKLADASFGAVPALPYSPL